MATFVVKNGLRILARDLKKLDASVPAQIKKINKDTANIVVTDAKGKGHSLGSTAGKATGNLRAGGGVGSIAILLGSASAPYAIGAELGSKHGKHKKQFKWFLGNIPFNAFDGSWGYFLGPTIRQDKDKILSKWQRDIEDLIGRTIPDYIA